MRSAIDHAIMRSHMHTRTHARGMLARMHARAGSVVVDFDVIVETAVVAEVVSFAIYDKVLPTTTLAG